LTPELMPPLQECRICCNQSGAVDDGRRSDETVSRIAMQVLKLSGEKRDVSRQRKL
jgi:hypothetical protein